MFNRYEFFCCSPRTSALLGRSNLILTAKKFQYMIFFSEHKYAKSCYHTVHAHFCWKGTTKHFCVPNITILIFRDQLLWHFTLFRIPEIYDNMISNKIRGAFCFSFKFILVSSASFVRDSDITEIQCLLPKSKFCDSRTKMYWILGKRFVMGEWFLTEFGWSFLFWNGLSAYVTSWSATGEYSVSSFFWIFI